MRNPTRVLLWMCLFLLILAGICALFYGPLLTAFLANPLFNGMILGVFLLGVILNLRQVGALNAQERWIEEFRQGNVDKEQRPPPAMLSPMSKMLTGRRGDRLSLSTVSLRTLLDGIRSRVDESRDLSRYMIGLLVFLGLLGTFWGLLATLASVGDVIKGLSVGGGDIEAVFTELKAGLQAPLTGMGTAFSSSLFGLGGSLALGFLDLQAGHAQNRFVNELEEWLAGQTKLSSGFGGGEGESPQSLPAYVQALLEQTAENLDVLQRTMGRRDEERHAANINMLALTEQIATLGEQMRSDQKLMIEVARRQAELQPLLSTLAESLQGGRGDETESLEHVRSLDKAVNRLVDGLDSQRGQLVEELRGELRLLTRTVARLRPDGESH